MTHTNVKKIFQSPIYVYYKKHFCPTCKEQLRKIGVSKIVNSNSPESRNFDFSQGDSYMVGDVKFIWTEFKCLKCGFQVSVRELKRIEKELKRIEYEKNE